jgi:hypothetical protein
VHGPQQHNNRARNQNVEHEVVFSGGYGHKIYYFGIAQTRLNPTRVFYGYISRSLVIVAHNLPQQKHKGTYQTESSHSN